MVRVQDTAASSAVVPEQRQDVQEQVDDVEVQRERREDVVVDRELELFVLAADDELRVVDDVHREDEDADRAVDHVHVAPVVVADGRDPPKHPAHDDHPPERHVQERSVPREVLSYNQQQYAAMRIQLVVEKCAAAAG